MTKKNLKTTGASLDKYTGQVFLQDPQQKDCDKSRVDHRRSVGIETQYWASKPQSCLGHIIWPQSDCTGFESTSEANILFLSSYQGSICYSLVGWPVRQMLAIWNQWQKWRIINLLYQNTRSCILVNDSKIAMFNIEHSVSHGYPGSPTLFNIPSTFKMTWLRAVLVGILTLLLYLATLKD